MKKLLTIVLSFSLLFVPLIVYAQSVQGSSNPPPVGSPLVREGDFAVKLVQVLKLGPAANETEAESMLTSAGIAPRNGWISDYPVTPDIIGELQNAVEAAGGSNRLPMPKDEALRAYRTTAVELGLPIIAEIQSEPVQGPPPTSPQYTEPSVVDDYYYEEGPPVVTYYPPPWDYAYLYAWVPSPFWWSGFFFPGFFILNDFDQVIFVDGHRCVVTNHVFDHDHHRSFTVDPVRRWRGTGDSLRAVSEEHNGRGFTTGEARRGAGSILRHSHVQAMPQRGLNRSHPSSSQAPRAPFFHGSNRGRMQIAPRRSFGGVSGGSERRFTVPGRNEGRSFNPPMRSENRSFSPPSMARRGFFEGFRGNIRSFSRGGFEHGRSFAASHGGSFMGRRR